MSFFLCQTFLFLLGENRGSILSSWIMHERERSWISNSILSLGLTSPSYLDGSGPPFLHLEDGTDVYLVGLCLEAVIFLLVVLANDNMAALPERRGCGWMFWVLALPSTPGASSCQGSCQGLFAVWDFTLAKPAAWHSWGFCLPKKAVQDKGWYNCITVFESCHLCCFSASKEDNASCEKRWIPAEEESPWKETMAWGAMCYLHLSASGMWMASPSATCANARQICLNGVRRPVSQLQ